MKKTGKFFIGLSTAAVLMAAAPMAVASAQAAENDALELAYGDINEDGNVTVADAVAILQAIANKDKFALSEQGAANADCYNTGDGLFYIVTMHREKDGSMKIKKCEPYFITTYINTANEYVIKPLNQDFVDYLYDVPRTNWAKYIERRIKINKEATKDYIEWQ